MVKELLEIILPVISFYNPQVGLYTTNGSSRHTYVYLLQLTGLIAQILNNIMGILLICWATCITNKLMKLSNFDIKCPVLNYCELKLCYLQYYVLYRLKETIYKTLML